MLQQFILYPVLVLVLQTMVVWAVMYYTRLRFMAHEHVEPQSIADARDADARLGPVSGPSNNFRNLAEVPPLFYLLAVVLFLLGQVDTPYLVGAWLFVGLRMIHSLIQCTNNRVPHRFAVYFLSTTLLWAMWLRLAWTLLA